MRVVIMGASKIASELAHDLEMENHEVIVIDLDEGGFRRLRDAFKGQKIVGSGTDMEIYKKINFSSEDAFIAATNSDNVNLSTAKLIQTTFNCKRVGKVVRDPFRARAFKKTEKGIGCPILDTAIHLKETVIDKIIDN